MKRMRGTWRAEAGGSSIIGVTLELDATLDEYITALNASLPKS
jgi:hypothetical protein